MLHTNFLNKEEAVNTFGNSNHKTSKEKNDLQYAVIRFIVEWWFTEIQIFLINQYFYNHLLLHIFKRYAWFTTLYRWLQVFVLSIAKIYGILRIRLMKVKLLNHLLLFFYELLKCLWIFCPLFTSIIYFSIEVFIKMGNATHTWHKNIESLFLIMSNYP